MAESADLSDGAASSGASSLKAGESKPTRYLPTDRIAFQKQLGLLRAFAVAFGTGKAVRTQEVATLMSMSATTVPLAIPFFVETGFLARVEAVGFTPSADVLAFHRAHDWNADTAGLKLRPALAASWFGEALIPRLTLRSMSVDHAVQVLAEACSAGKRHRPNLEVLLDYLLVGGLIERDGEQLIATRATPGPASSETERAAPAADSSPQPATRATIATAFSQQPTEGLVQFHVSVKVDMAEFAGWRPERIAAFFNGIAAVLAAKGEIEKGAT